MRLLLSLIIALFFLSCKAPEAADPLRGKLDSIFAMHPAFNGAVLIAIKGNPIFHEVFGYRDYESKVPLGKSDVFELASVSKQFTSMIIMMLKEEGKLGYDDLLEKYVPGLPYPGITVRHLLTHTSGLPEYELLMDKYWDKTKVAGNMEIIQYLKDYHPEKLFNPGERYDYSNTGYVLLGSIAEAAGGKDFIALCRERIFVPVGMNSTDIRSLEEKAAVANFAPGYIYVPEKTRYMRADSFPNSNYIFWLGNRKGPGRVSSTTSDLLRWDRALYGEALVRNETLMEAYAGYRLKNDSISNYGFGWNLDIHPTLGRKIWHTGSNPGYSTRIVRFIDADKTIIVLSNNAYGEIEAIDRALDSVLGLGTTPNNESTN